MLSLILNRAYTRAITARLNGSDPSAAVPSGGRTEELLVMAMFGLMGRIAKMDGRVTQAEVRFASTIMKLMGLENDDRLKAIRHFETGKQGVIDYLPVMRELVRIIGQGSVLSDLFLKIQCRAAFVKGDMRLEEKVLLRDVAEILGFDKMQFLAICSEMQGSLDTQNERSDQFIYDAYRVLQLEPEVEDGEIRRAYLRLMSRYHPDKLMHDDLSEDSMKRAQEKSMAIRAAYETICGFRKLRA